jgi:predicted nucleic acid-binding protein
MAGLPFLNTNILLRHFTQDSTTLSPRATALIRRIEAGELIVSTTDTVVFEAVYTLQRFYRLDRPQIRELLSPFLRLRSVRLPGKRRYRRTFELYVRFPSLSFADCYHAAYMESRGLIDLISFDRDMDRVTSITRKEPDATGFLSSPDQLPIERPTFR